MLAFVVDVVEDERACVVSLRDVDAAVHSDQPVDRLLAAVAYRVGVLENNNQTDDEQADQQVLPQVLAKTRRLGEDPVEQEIGTVEVVTLAGDNLSEAIASDKKSSQSISSNFSESKKLECTLITKK